jgi:hypothetical protein
LLASLVWVLAVAEREAAAQAIGPGQGAALQISTDAMVAHVFTMPAPTLTTRPADVSFRAPLGSLPSPGSSTLIGSGLGVQLVFADRLVLPLFGTEFFASVGHRDRVLSAVDGTIVEQHPWSTQRVGVTLFGAGLRFKHRRWMFGASAVPGFNLTFTEAAWAQGADTTQGSAIAISFLFRAQVEGCRRLDPETRACLFAGANLYDGGLLRGALGGFRLEFGP